MHNNERITQIVDQLYNLVRVSRGAPGKTYAYIFCTLSKFQDETPTRDR